jgi:hypothetical protein
MPKRSANYRLVKIHRSYTVEEAAEILSHHENTIRTWLKEGLTVCDDRRPVLILGKELHDFLKARRTKNKRPCKFGELYCFRCRSPRIPAGAMADCLYVSAKIRQLQAICPDCFCLMNRQVSLAKLDQFQAIFDITFREAQEQVINITKPNVNSDFEGGV